MAYEIEKRFKNFEYKKLKELFEKNNIKKNGGMILKVSSFVGTKPKQTIRTRTEGNKITFTIKSKGDPYDKEWEVVVDNQEMMDLMLNEMGIKKAFTLEKFREMYISDNGDEIVFDHFPGLPPYLEVESKNETNLNSMMGILGLKDEPRFIGKDLYFEHYGITKDRSDEDLTFGNAVESLSPYITKNKEMFMKIISHQKDFLQKYN
jgi:adenylate cyclase class 2